MRKKTTPFLPFLALSLSAGLAATSARAQTPPATAQTPNPALNNDLKEPDFDDADDEDDEDEEPAPAPPRRAVVPSPAETQNPFLYPQTTPTVPSVRPAPASAAAPRPAALPAPRAVAPIVVVPAAARRPPVAPPPDDDEFDPYAKSPVRAFLGLSGMGLFVLNQSGGPQFMGNGGGYYLTGGVDVGHVFSLEVGYAGTFSNQLLTCNPDHYYSLCESNYLMLQTLSMDIKLHLPTGTRLVPFIQGGGLVAWLSREGNILDASGGGGQAGGGFEIWVADHLTIVTRVLYRGVKIDDYGFAPGRSTVLNMVHTEMGLAVRF